MRVSIVTPNLNRAHFLRQTMDSVLAAECADLAYVVMDGGSNDGSLAVIEERRRHLHAVVSEPDGGVYEALNRGFAQTDGEVMGWINSGDIIFPDSLSIICEIFEQHPQIEWLTSHVLSFLDESGRLVEQHVHPGVARESYLRGEHLQGFSPGRTLSLIQQESTFWRRSLWEKAGARLDTSLRLAADFELWTRFFEYAELWSVSAPLGAFRRHADQLSGAGWNAYLAEAHKVLTSRGTKPNSQLAQTLSVGLRRNLPRALRPVAHALKLFSPAPQCNFDHKTQVWKLDRY